MSLNKMGFIDYNLYRMTYLLSIIIFAELIIVDSIQFNLTFGSKALRK